MNKKQMSLKLSAVALAVLLASCGGGGSEGYYNQGSSSGGSSTNPSTGENVTSVNISQIELIDLNGAKTQAITAEGVTAKVKVTDQAGNGIGGALVTFTASGGVVFGSSNGAVLTNADGWANISAVPENTSTTGAYKISANVDYNGKAAMAKDHAFSLQSLNVILANILAADTLLEAGGSTNITLKTQTQNGVNQNNVAVNFTASCGTFEPSTVTSANQGDVITTYKAIAANGDLCQGQPKITASSLNSALSAQVSVSIAEINADSLVYTTTAPVDLGIKNSGSAASGQIEFTLYANGTPAKDKEVRVELTEAPPDLNFISLGNRDSRVVKSNSNGKVIVNLYPGSVSGPVEIKATLVSAPNVSALSKNVKISTGRVTQNGVSLSVSKQSLRTDIDGDTSIITARMRDRVGNAVPEGTVISFVSEGGKVDPNCATDKNGVCSVTLTTQSPRPLNNRVSVLAYVEGDKDYQDNDKDNLYTAGIDQLTDNIGDFFRDDNEDNTFNVGEFIYEKAAGVLNCAASSIVQPNVPNTCNNGLSAVLRQQLIFSFAHDTPTYVWNSGIDSNTGKILNGSGSFSFQIFGNSLKTVPMPSGTEVSVAVKDNTDFKPTAALTPDSKDASKKLLKVSGAEPNTLVKVKIDGTEYSVSIDASGTGELSLPATVTGSPEVVYQNLSCEAEIRGGNVTVPSAMNLLTPATFQNIGNSAVGYTIRLRGCIQGDDVKITTSVPNGKSLTTWLDVK